MSKPKEPEWYFCDECDTWVGSIPPRQPYLWTNDKAAANHKAGTGHTPQRITFDQIVLPEKRDDETRTEG